MKNKITIVSLFLITMLVSALFINVKVNAEEVVTTEVPTETTETTTTENPSSDDVFIVDEEEIKTQAETWLEENIGSILGVSIGSIITIVTLLITLYKKTKQFIAIVKEFRQLKDDTNNDLESTKKVLSNANQCLIDTQKDFVKILEHLDKTDKLVIETKETFDNLKTNLEKLENVQLLIATHTNELVASGVGEKVVEILKNKGE